MTDDDCILIRVASRLFSNMNPSVSSHGVHAWAVCTEPGNNK